MKQPYILQLLPDSLCTTTNGTYEVIKYSFRYNKHWISRRKVLCIKIKIVFEQERTVQINYSENLEKTIKNLRQLLKNNQKVYVKFYDLSARSYNLNASSGITLYASDFSIFEE